MESNTIKQVGETQQVRPKGRGGAPKGNVNARKHGISTARKLLKDWGTLALDGRSPIVKERNAWLARVVEDKGGRENLSELKLTHLEGLADEWLIVRSVTLYVLTLPSLANKRKRTLHPVVMQWQQLKDGFARRCQMAGLEREARKVPELGDYLAEKAKASE